MNDADNRPKPEGKQISKAIFGVAVSLSGALNTYWFLEMRAEIIATFGSVSHYRFLVALGALLAAVGVILTVLGLRGKFPSDVTGDIEQ